MEAGVASHWVKMFAYKECVESNVTNVDRKTEWYVVYLRWATVPALKQFFAWKNNLKRLRPFSVQESEKHHSIIKEEHFLTIYV